MKDPYIQRKAGDYITAKDWNDMQGIIREALDAHTHSGEADQGVKLTGEAIDSSTPLTINGLDVTGDLKVDKSGNVGIGTMNPKARLTIQNGQTDSSAQAEGKTVFVSGPLGAGTKYDGGIEFRNVTLKQGVGFGSQSIFATGSNEDQPLHIYSRGKSPLTLNAHGGGDVGIGTTAPTDKLEVKGNIKLTSPDNKNIFCLDMQRQDEDGRRHQWKLWHMNKAYGQNSFQIWEYKTDDKGKDCGGSSQKGAICTHRLTIKEGGNVGIGTNDPKAKLDVDGPIKAKEFQTTLFSAGGTNAVELQKDNKWRDLHDLILEINLPNAAAVLIFYQISMDGGKSHICTRLNINGNVEKQSQTINGNYDYWSPCNMTMTKLQKGKHKIVVQYRTPKGGTNNPGKQDRQNRTLQVLVMGSI